MQKPVEVPTHTNCDKQTTSKQATKQVNWQLIKHLIISKSVFLLIGSLVYLFSIIFHSFQLPIRGRSF